MSANNNSLQYIDPNAFDAINNITYLALNYNLLTSEVLSYLRHFWFVPTLKELHLRGNRISYMVPNWKRIFSLEILDLSRNNITALKVTIKFSLYLIYLLIECYNLTSN